MTDWQHALHVARRMTVADWAHGIACVGIVVGWTMFAMGIQP